MNVKINFKNLKKLATPSERVLLHEAELLLSNNNDMSTLIATRKLNRIAKGK